MSFNSVKNYFKKISVLSYFVRKYRFWRIKNSSYKISKGGFKFIGPSNMLDGEFEKEEVAFFNQALEQSDIFINVGAKIGYYVCAAIIKNKKVLAFEPDSSNYSLLLKNIKLNDFNNNCLALNCGVGDNWQTLKIYHASTGSSFLKGWANNSSLFYNETQVVGIDDFSFSKYEKLFFLVDVEGFESYVIQGAIKTLMSSLPQIWMIEIMTSDEYGEIDDFAKRQQSLVTLFEQNFFSLYKLTDIGIQSIGYDELKYCIKNRESTYGHNFIFIKN